MGWLPPRMSHGSSDNHPWGSACGRGLPEHGRSKAEGGSALLWEGLRSQQRHPRQKRPSKVPGGLPGPAADSPRQGGHGSRAAQRGGQAHAGCWGQLATRRWGRANLVLSGGSSGLILNSGLPQKEGCCMVKNRLWGCHNDVQSRRPQKLKLKMALARPANSYVQ